MDNLFLLIINGQLCLLKDEIVYSLQEHIPSLDWLLQNLPANELMEKLLIAQGRLVDKR